MGWFQKVLSRKRVEPKINYDNIIRSYGAVLEATSGETVSNSNALPLPKADLAHVLLAAIIGEKDQTSRENLTLAFVSLGNFVELTDEEQDVVDHMDSIFKRKSKDLDEATIDLMANKGYLLTELMEKTNAQRKSLEQELERRQLW
jgi:hypothetical protein